jgi:hypothetical protein
MGSDRCRSEFMRTLPDPESHRYQIPDDGHWNSANPCVNGRTVRFDDHGWRVLAASRASVE